MLLEQKHLALCLFTYNHFSLSLFPLFFCVNFIIIFMKYSISALLGLVISTGMTDAQTTDKNINALIDSIRTEYNIPAIAVAVIKPDTCYYGIDGTSQINGHDKVDLRSKFHLGSNSKAITSLIAFKMIENGQISLDTTIGEMFPELKGEIRKDYEQVSLGNLLSHNGGIQPYTSGTEYVKIPPLEGTISEKRYGFTRFVLNEKPVKKGTYSNAGYIIAALMLEKASGKTYENLVQKTMQDLHLGYFIGFPNHEDPRYPWGHWMENGKLTPLAPDHFYKLNDYAASAGDISMNVVDYAHFIQLHLKGLLGDNNYLTSTDYQSLHFALDNYSYGWGNTTLPDGSRVSYHDGSAGTYYCHTIIIPSKKIAIIVMLNSAEDNQVDGIYALRKILSKRYSD